MIGDYDITYDTFSLTANNAESERASPMIGDYDGGHGNALPHTR